MKIDAHMGAAVCGLTADGRSLIEHARVESQNHFFVYNEKIKVSSIAQSICDKAISFGEDEESDMVK